MSSPGSCHEPPNNYISLGRCGAGRVFMRYFGASGSVIHCRYIGGVVPSVFEGHRNFCSPLFPLKQFFPASS
jgi:hypothetical protein